AGAEVRAVADDPLDRVWPGQPAAPIAPVVPHPEQFSGESAESKRTRLGRALQQEGVAAVVLTMPESIAWLLNIRGGDVPHTPLPLSFAILRQDGSVSLFIDRRKLVSALERHLGNTVTVMPPEPLGLAREAPNGRLSEIAAGDKLEAFRREGEHFRDLSFPTISGAGSNGAIVHYRAMPETEKRLEPGTLYLLDSGAQYVDGTTDVTRTIAVGEPSAEMRDRFSRVLKGHIALALARFPKGTTGTQLDGFARRALWQEGLDYDHGTGHGVGSYLGVH